MATQADIGVVGLAVMGQNLALNLESRGFTVAVFNRTAERTKDLMATKGAGRKLVPAYAPEEFAASLTKPRRILLMVKAGAGVDETAAHLLPHLEAGDILIDGGNSHFRDTERRQAEMAAKGIEYLGCGVSGGEEGALRGPSIMPGGERAAYDHVAPHLEAIAAKSEDGPCCAYLGRGGAGHFVKMVHNGIEYAMMQMLAEAYDVMRLGFGWTVPQAQKEFARWNRGPGSGYLVEITGLVLAKTDPDTRKPLVELIVDKAEQKGTGKWTTMAALDLGVPVPAITSAVDARIVSGHRAERQAVAKAMPAKPRTMKGWRGAVAGKKLERGCYAGFLAAYAQGMHLLGRADAEYGYGLDLAEVARIWKAGCIIRSTILRILKQAYAAPKPPVHPFVAVPIRAAIKPALPDLRAVVSAAAVAGLPTPALSAALGYIDAFGRARLPANLTQAQRDCFGAHTYERLDKPGTFHTQWE